MSRNRSILCVAFALLLVESDPRSLLRAAEPTAIFVMKVDGGDVRRVADVPGFPQLGSPRWSHDAKQLTFDAAATDSGDRRWYLVNADGGKVREMGRGGQPDFSPDDKQLVFDVRARAGSNASDKPGIWVQNVDGQGRNWLAAGTAPRYSPGGDALAILDGESLAVFDLVELASRKLNVSPVVAAGFDWSPDGDKLAVVTQASGTPGEGAQEKNQRQLWIVGTSDADPPKKLLAGDVDGTVSWSPDGKQIAISLAGKIHLLAADGTTVPQPVPAQEGVNRMPAWSHDGRLLAFASTRKTPALAPVATTRRALQLQAVKNHSRGNVVYGLDLSLDGRQVLMGGKKDLEIWNLDTDESNKLDLHGEWVALSPDGRTVAQCGPLVKIALGSLETGKPIRDLSTGSMCTNVEFSPDGSRVVCGTIDKNALAFDVASGKRLCAVRRAQCADHARRVPAQRR